MPPPIQIQTMLQNLDELVDQFIVKTERFQTTYLQDQICKLTQQLHACKKLSQRKDIEKCLNDKIWFLENRRNVAKSEVMLQNPYSIHSLWNQGEGDWKALVWVSSTSQMEVELRDKFVKEILRGDVYTDHNRFQDGGFTRLRLYDLLEEVNDTFFSAIRRQRNKKVFELRDVNGVKVLIEAKWVADNIEEEIIGEALQLCQQQSADFVEIPVGSFSNRDCPQSHMISMDGPIVTFRNNATRPMCMLRSFASGLHYLGYAKASAAIAMEIEEKNLASQLSQLNLASGSRFGQLTDFDERVKQAMKLEGFLKVRLKKNWMKKQRYNPLLLEHRTNHPIAASLKVVKKGKSGKMSNVQIGHCVCFVGDYIFDSNMERAQSISVDSLNNICSSIVPGSMYNGLYWSRELLLSPNNK
jgi:hypothetical protein